MFSCSRIYASRINIFSIYILTHSHTGLLHTKKYIHLGSQKLLNLMHEFSLSLLKYSRSDQYYLFLRGRILWFLFFKELLFQFKEIKIYWFLDMCFLNRIHQCLPHTHTHICVCECVCMCDVYVCVRVRYIVGKCLLIIKRDSNSYYLKL